MGGLWRKQTAKSMGKTKKKRGLPTGYAQSIHISTGPPPPSNFREGRHVIPRRQCDNTATLSGFQGWPGASYCAGSAKIKRRQNGRVRAQPNDEIDGEPVSPAPGNCDATSGGHGPKKQQEGGPTGDAQAIRISTASPSPDFTEPGMSYRAGSAMIRRRQHGRAVAQTNGEIDGEPVLPTAGACGKMRCYK